MIRLDNVNKYFNRYKKNQIHVINNSNLSLPSSGLIALLGPSGCGKTTLLNAIGGLDKVNSGHIYIDGKKITKRTSGKIDEIRNLNIGYIFQDYKLVENMTVYENVALSLKIIGIKDKEEIKKRVLYTLDKVKMTRYKNRPVNMLSGGERQRVGIARAIVKNPKIIIADEPTGNLDSKNSLEIMNIIKSISSKYLVVLVTHEVDLAKFFADRIVELKDGLITNDYKNKFEGSLNYKIENRIYLKDFKDKKNITKDNLNINVYRDNDEQLNIDIVFKNGNIYIETKGEEKAEIIDNNSNIELIDDHYKEIEIKEIKDDTFNIESISNNKYIEKYSSIFHLASFITYGFKKIIDYPFLKKILLGGFFLSGMFIFYSVSSIFATVNIKDEDFVTMNKEYLTATVKNLSVDDYLEFENNQNIEYIIPSDSIINLNLNYDKYLQTQFHNGLFSGSLSDINSLNESDIILGRMPNNKYELVVDKQVLEKFMEESATNMAGFFKVEDFLNHQVFINNIDNFTIVGISNKNEPNIYADKKMFINIVNNSSKKDNEETKELVVDYELLIDKKIKLVSGKLPLNDYEVIVHENNKLNMELNKNIETKVNGKKLKVVGYYDNLLDNDFNGLLVNNNTIKYNLITNATNLSIYSLDKEDTLNYLYDEKINVKDSYEYAKSNYIDSQKDSIIDTLVVAGVILGISLIEILLMIRSSFLSRIKEVGIYRAIGVKKSDIYKMFAGEIFAITITSSLTGIILMTYILYSISKIDYLQRLFMVNITTFAISFGLVLIFNLIVGLLPVYNTIRKTPAEILSRFDVD